MNYNKFTSKFSVFKTKKSEKISDILNMPGVDNNFLQCIKMLGGKSYNYGLYQVFNNVEVLESTNLIWNYFPEYNKKVTVFACDWLCRYFAVDARNSNNNKLEVLLFDTGASEVFQIPQDIVAFHNEEIVNYTEEALALNFFAKWRSTTQHLLETTEGVGYKIPLFIGGKDTIQNLELIDRNFYTYICFQIKNKIINLKEGETIKTIKFID